MIKTMKNNEKWLENNENNEKNAKNNQRVLEKKNKNCEK